eukprot:scaffold7257_cov65-Phaeocystis_antarctica.AAC.14
MYAERLRGVLSASDCASRQSVDEPIVAPSRSSSSSSGIGLPTHATSESETSAWRPVRSTCTMSSALRKPIRWKRCGAWRKCVAGSAPE